MSHGERQEQGGRSMEWGMGNEERRGDVQGEEDADAGPDASGLGGDAVAKGLEKGENDEDGRLAVAE